MALGACGGKTSAGGATASRGTATLSGSVGGTTFTPVSVYANEFRVRPCVPEDGGTFGCSFPPIGQELNIVLSNRSDLTCGTSLPYSGDAYYANLAQVTLALVLLDGEPGTGTYRVSADNGTGGSSETSDSTCTVTSVALFLGGTVTITSLTATHVTGTFDMSGPSGETGGFSGTFDTDLCPTSDDGGVARVQPTTCQP
jgi:hypothetical protein